MTTTRTPNAGYEDVEAQAREDAAWLREHLHHPFQPDRLIKLADALADMRRQRDDAESWNWLRKEEIAALEAQLTAARAEVERAELDAHEQRHRAQRAEADVWAAEREQDEAQWQIANLINMLEGTRSTLTEATIQNTKQGVRIDDLNQMVLRYLYRAENAERERDRYKALAEGERERCAQVAEGPLYKQHYRGDERGNWSIDGSSDYGNGRLNAARAIRALPAPSPAEERQPTEKEPSDA